MYLDCHTHLDFFNDNIYKAIEDINENEIITLANSMDVESYLLNKEFSNKSQYIVPCFGVHPWRAKNFNMSLEELIPYIEECYVIGEIGLDTVWVEDNNSLDKQREIFYFIAKEAIKRNKVMCLHTKGCEEEIYNFLKEHNYNKVIIHWYSGDLKTLEKYVDLGCYFSISVDLGIKEEALEVLKRIPKDKLLTETDGPTALQWVNGKYGYPSEVKRIVLLLEEYLNDNNISERILQNWNELYRKVDSSEKIE